MLQETDLIRLKGIITTLRNMKVRALKGRISERDQTALDAAALTIEDLLKRNGRKI